MIKVIKSIFYPQQSKYKHRLREKIYICWVGAPLPDSPNASTPTDSEQRARSLLPFHLKLLISIETFNMKLLTCFDDQVLLQGLP
jgi:hypothetical protein